MIRTWAVLGGVVTLALCASPLVPARSETSGYRFNDIAVARANPHSVVVRYGYSWAGPEFPGWVTCVWTVEDLNGELVAEKTVQIVGLKRSYASKEIEIPKTLEPTKGKPERARVSCGATRLDAQDGEYSLSGVTAKLNPEFAGDRRSVSLSFDVNWSGAGMPGVGECVARIRASDGSLLFEHPFTLTSADGSSLSMRAIAPSDLAQDPASSDVECVPYSG